MSTFSFSRLFVQVDLSHDQNFVPEKEQLHYLLNVMRLKEGQKIFLFNGRQGEWLAQLCEVTRKKCTLHIIEQVRPQHKEGGLPLPNIHYLFAPIKRGRLDYMVQKATELGVAHLQPVLTNHTNIGKIKLARMEANVIEAAEQCGILRIPTVNEPMSLATVLENWDEKRTLIFCDEAAPLSSPLEALGALSRHSPVAVLIGPEGGFSEKESKMLKRKDYILPVSLGPRIMRADTAGVAVLSLVNAVLADWA